MRWPKYWSFSFSIIPSKEIPGLISFRMDWSDLLAVQGTLKSLQHHSSKVSILRCSAFFTVQLLHPYMTTGKTIALTRRTKLQWLAWQTLCCFTTKYKVTLRFKALYNDQISFGGLIFYYPIPRTHSVSSFLYGLTSEGNSAWDTFFAFFT